MRRLHSGKVPTDVLGATFLKLTGSKSEELLTPPRPGLDFAVVRAGGRYLIVSADPVTGVTEDIGRYAIDVNANDIATSGNRPQFAESVVLLPEESTVAHVQKIARELDAEAKKLGISLVGGHTEVTPGLKRPILVVTAFSIVDRFVSSQGARSGDTMVMTKTAGIEGTAVLTRDREFLRQICVVDEATAAYKTGFVHAMHDCTEGGILGAAFEMSLASDVGFELMAARVPVAEETAKVCRRLGLDPLKLIGSGSLLMAVPKGREEEVARALSPHCVATAVGRFVAGGRTLVTAEGRRTAVQSAPEDELWRALRRVPHLRNRLDV